jgi:acetyltransferase-like isoleucine patch superfamily enzyme
MASYGAEFLPIGAVRELGFASVGEGVKVHPSAILVGVENIHIGSHSRIDAYTIITASSSFVRIGAYVHIGAGCYLAGGGGVTIEDLSTLSQGVKIYSVNDDYSGNSLTNPTVPSIYKSVKQAPVHLGRHVIVGTGSVILPGLNIAEGCAVGALSLISQTTAPWGIYGGVPARRLKERSRDLLAIEERFLRDIGLRAV